MNCGNSTLMHIFLLERSEDVHLQNWQLWIDKNEDKSNQCCCLIAPDSLPRVSVEHLQNKTFLFFFAKNVKFASFLRQFYNYFYDEKGLTSYPNSSTTI